MLGKEDKQTSFFDAGFICSHLMDKNSFYAKMRDCADKIITDDDFADIYCLDNGRPSVPPARLTKVLILQNYENLSDREALEMLRFDIRWKYALNYEGFDRSLLVYFRARLLINHKEKMVFKKSLELARETGLLKEKVDQVIDSTPMLGAGAVKDTYELLRDGIRKILSLMDKKKKSRINLSLKAYGKNDPKPKINWDDKKERQELLSLLVSDVKEVLSHVDVNKEDVDNQLKDAANLLARIVSQDIEEDKENKPKIKKGVAKDRVISTTDPEMRHGRKSRSGKFNGYKTHLIKDVDSDIITNIDVSPGNCPDGDMAEPLIDEASKAPPLKDTEKLNKEEFDVDVKNEKVVCPEGKVAEKCYKSKDAEGKVVKTFVFSKEVCNTCPRKGECTSAKNTGRTVSVGPYEEYLQKIRGIQKTEEFKEIYNKRRPPVERKIAELIHHGLRKTRYIGKRKSRLQALFTAAAVNLKRIFKEQQEKKVNLDIVPAISVAT